VKPAAPFIILRPDDPAAMDELQPGDSLDFAGGACTVEALGADLFSSVPTSVDLRFEAVGGTLTIAFRYYDLTVELTEIEASVVAVLLAAGGSYVSDHELARRVWPRDFDAGPQRLKLAIHRVRQRLDRVGLDGMAVIQKRCHRSRDTRFGILAPETKVGIE